MSNTVERYLARLEQAAAGLSTSRREELVDEIREHIEGALEQTDGGEAAIRSTLAALGTPEEIVAAEGRSEPATAPPAPRPARVAGRDLAAILFLLLGGFVFLGGWLVGVALLWSSPTWNVRDKLIGSLVVPGGLTPAPLLLLLVAGPASAVTGVLLGLVLVVAPIATAIYLARQARNGPPTLPAH